MYTRNKLPGFTLVELIVAISVLAVLATVSISQVQNVAQNARNSVRLSDLSEIGNAIHLAAVQEKRVNLTELKKITYVTYPNNTNVYLGDLTNDVFGMGSIPPVDPDTKQPYAVGVFVDSSGRFIYGQVGGVLKTHEELPGISSDTPMQKVVGNYDISTTNLQGMPAITLPWLSGLIPRAFLENPEAYKQTDAYLSGALIWGSSKGSQYNTYLYALDKLPVTQFSGQTQSGYLVYDSFEGQNAYLAYMRGYKQNNNLTYPACVGINSVTHGYESATAYGDGLQTIECSIDRNVWTGWTNSSFYTKWIRDSVSGDGQFNYILFDPLKKYEISLDIMATLSGTVNLSFYCKGDVFFFNKTKPLTTSSGFVRHTAYINLPDPSGNGMSYYPPANTPKSFSCILYRLWAPKAGSELWVDNFIVREVP